MAKLSSAAAISQVMAFFSAPILARLFPPEAFGSYALFSSIAGILGCLACWRYQQALVLPESNDDARMLVVGCLGILCLWTCVAFLILLAFRETLCQLLNWPEGRGLMFWVVPLLALGGLAQIADSWLVRTGRFGFKGAERAASSLSTISANLLFGIQGLATGGYLVFSGFVGAALGLAIQARGVRDMIHDGFRDATRSRVKAQLVRYRRFPLIDSWAGLLNVSSVNLAPLLLGAFFSQAIVGQYSRCLALVQAPMVLIGAAVGQVFYQRAAREKSTGQLPGFVRRVFVLLVAGALFPFCFLGIAGREIFVLFLGNRWEMAGEFSQLASPWCLAVFIGSPLSTLLFVFEKQNINLLFNVFTVLVRAACLLYGGQVGNAYLAVSAFAFGGTLLWVGLIGYLLRLSGLHLWSTLRGLLPSFVLCAICVGLLCLFRCLTQPKPVTSIALGVVVSVAYAAAVLWLQPGIRQLRPLLRSAGSLQ